MTDQSKVTVFDYSPDGRYPKEKARTGTKFSSELFADAAVRHLEQRDRAKPFVCSVAFTSPHDPRTAPARFAAMYPPERMKLPANCLPQHPFDNGDMKVRDELLAGFPRTEAEIRRHLADYYAMVSEVDFQIGRILDALERTGEAANTYIVFAGDNGLAVGQHGLMGKQNLYEHSVRVPLILCGPGIPRGGRNASLVHLMDIGPTVCELAGEKLASATDGRSLADAARKGARVARESEMLAYLGVQRGLRTEDWKLIEYNVGGVRTTQLFDLRKDPLEMHNLAGEPAQAGRVREMRARLAAQLKAAGDKEEWLAPGRSPAAGMNA
jgi:arylsulfatase A-like enzyme